MASFYLNLDWTKPVKQKFHFLGISSYKNQPAIPPDKMSYNSSFYCPITGELMIDPVVDLDGNTFERKAIEV